ncbi:hypothetical protein NLJ89_g6760 [Agrocybe chaxingu]|uniref:Putative gamma-glutamylcyclotransferase n=1 Tax=Agrocybe chaxingu TaxID=84603 RepID=A0A9W8MSD2_9AGAR|nr:hypothetical protein NLJ89_g6760 [Agrocybe chaxingu]
MPEYTSFFYGTLMHPKILTRVIANDGKHLKFCPAVLLDHTRHKVKYADYPGVIPSNQAKSLFEYSLTQEERSVRGTLVIGLTAKDIYALDIFEGSEYSRESIPAHPLDSLHDISAYALKQGSLPAHPPPLPPTSELLPPIPAHTYIYRDEKNLEAQLWSYEDFVEKNAWKWHGEAADNNEDITEVDRRRENGQKEVEALGA